MKREKSKLTVNLRVMKKKKKAPNLKKTLAKAKFSQMF